MGISVTAASGIKTFFALTQYFNNSLKNNEYRYYIDTIKEKLEYSKEPISNPDINHYDSLSMIELGKLFSKTLFENAII